MAKAQGYLIVTKDTDFLELSLLRGAPPKVVLLRIGNVPTTRIEALLRQHVTRIHQFDTDKGKALLIIGR
jgi:predicted nuclease of predicted toxin-antitoxin system